MIALDLEWNTVFFTDEDGSRQHFDEIIQIGAVRFEAGFCPAEVFNAYVHNRAGHLTPAVAELVHLSDRQLEEAEDFPAVAGRFLSWCGENPRFFTWSSSDVPVLRQNLLHYGLDTTRLRRAYNVQLAYSILKQGNTTAVALNKAVERCGLTQDEVFHSAAGDAVYTARIMQLLWQEYGGKTREKLLYSQLQKLREARRETRRPREPVPLEEAESLEAWLKAPWRYSRACCHKKLPCNTHRKAYFRQSSAREILCPECKKALPLKKWQLLEENRYGSQTVCQQHGRFCALMRLRRKNPYLWEGVIDLYREADCPLLAQRVNQSDHT